MKNSIVHIIVLSLLSFACAKEQYRVDNKNKLNKHAAKSNEYLAKQAHKITHENLKRKEKNQKKSTKTTEQLVKDLHHLNHKTSKVKKTNSTDGTFSLY
ncbi:MAG: hypothetical protein U0U66_04355 [Cytophagaceae bacterium]